MERGTTSADLATTARPDLLAAAEALASASQLRGRRGSALDSLLARAGEHGYSAWTPRPAARPPLGPRRAPCLVISTLYVRVYLPDSCYKLERSCRGVE